MTAGEPGPVPRTQEDAEQLVRSLLALWREANDEMEAASRHVRGLTKMIEGLVHIYPALRGEIDLDDVLGARIAHLSP